MSSQFSKPSGRLNFNVSFDRFRPNFKKSSLNSLDIIAETLERLNREQMKREALKRRWSRFAEQLQGSNHQKKHRITVYLHRYQSIKAKSEINSKQIESIAEQPFVDLSSFNLQRIESTIAVMEDVFHRIESRDHDEESTVQFRDEKRYLDSKSKAWMEDNERMKKELIELQSRHKLTVSKVDHSKAYRHAMANKEKDAMEARMKAQSQNERSIASESVLSQQEHEKKETVAKRKDIYQQMLEQHAKRIQDHKRLISETQVIQRRMDELCQAKTAFLEELQRREGNLRREIAKHRLNLSEKSEKMANSERKYEELMAKKRGIEAQIESLTLEMEPRNEHITRLNAMIDDENTKLSEMEQSLASVNSDLQQCVQTLSDLCDGIHLKKSMLDKMEKEIPKSDALCVEFEETIQGANDEYCAFKKECTGEYGKMVDQWMRLKNELEDKLAQIRNNKADADKQNESTMNTIHGLVQDASALQQSIEMHQQSALNQNVNRLRDEYNACKEELKALEAEIEAMAKERNALKHEYETTKSMNQMQLLKTQEEIREIVVAHKQETIGYSDDKTDCDDEYKEKANQYLADWVKRHEAIANKKRDKFEKEIQHLLDAIKEQKEKRITIREQIKKIENERHFEERIKKTKTKRKAGAGGEDEEYIPSAAEAEGVEDEEDLNMVRTSLRERARTRLEAAKKKGKKNKKKKNKTYGSVSRRERRNSLQKRRDSIENNNNNNEDGAEKDGEIGKKTKAASGKKRVFSVMNADEEGTADGVSVQSTTRSKRKKRRRTLSSKKITSI